uniref:Uncharacterized protein n=1 Tax=Timema shepardi TaxID=629360 RepID=A0A7R9AYZ1_TIMSH|nr:unnamed protein product [Timema shepardi]
MAASTTVRAPSPRSSSLAYYSSLRSAARSRFKSQEHWDSHFAVKLNTTSALANYTTEAAVEVGGSLDNRSIVYCNQSAAIQLI